MSVSWQHSWEMKWRLLTCWRSYWIDGLQQTEADADEPIEVSVGETEALHVKLHLRVASEVRHLVGQDLIAQNNRVVLHEDVQESPRWSGNDMQARFKHWGASLWKKTKKQNIWITRMLHHHHPSSLLTQAIIRRVSGPEDPDALCVALRDVHGELVALWEFGGSFGPQHHDGHVLQICTSNTESRKCRPRVLRVLRFRSAHVTDTWHKCACVPFFFFFFYFQLWILISMWGCIHYSYKDVRQTKYYQISALLVCRLQSHPQRPLLSTRPLHPHSIVKLIYLIVSLICWLCKSKYDRLRCQHEKANSPDAVNKMSCRFYLTLWPRSSCRGPASSSRFALSHSWPAGRLRAHQNPISTTPNRFSTKPDVN